MEQNGYGSISIATMLGMNILQHHLVVSDLTSFNVSDGMGLAITKRPNFSRWVNDYLSWNLPSGYVNSLLLNMAHLVRGFTH